MLGACRAHLSRLLRTRSNAQVSLQVLACGRCHTNAAAPSVRTLLATCRSIHSSGCPHRCRCSRPIPC